MFLKGCQILNVFVIQVAAISEEAFDPAEQHLNSKQDSSNPLRWKSFNMRSVVAATEDLLIFILSEKGRRVRLHLTRDVLQTVDAFLQDAVVAQNSYEDFNERKRSTSEVTADYCPHLSHFTQLLLDQDVTYGVTIPLCYWLEFVLDCTWGLDFHLVGLLRHAFIALFILLLMKVIMLIIALGGKHFTQFLHNWFNFISSLS